MRTLLLGCRVGHAGALALCAAALAGCAAQPARYAKRADGRYYDAQLGAFSSPRLFEDGEAIPRGGGQYLVGRPYVIAGRAYYPNERPDGYVAVGTASWYGDAFHGRRTANGEVFDKNSISAAHPTLPLPSYVRVTNTGNGRSMIVRVNDRGPYHGGRVMDVSQRVAEALDFRRAGTARIKVEYVGRASLAGSDDEKLIATLRTDGGPASLGGGSDQPTMLASGEPPPSPPAPALRAAVQEVRATDFEGDGSERAPIAVPPRRRYPAPVPPQRPFDVGEGTRITMVPPRPVARPTAVISFAPPVPRATTAVRDVAPRLEHRPDRVGDAGD